MLMNLTDSLLCAPLAYHWGHLSEASLIKELDQAPLIQKKHKPRGSINIVNAFLLFSGAISVSLSKLNAEYTCTSSVNLACSFTGKMGHDVSLCCECSGPNQEPYIGSGFISGLAV